MAQHYNVEAVVYIWNYGGPSHPGHAAMKLRGAPNAPSDAYISFWPGGDTGATIGTAFKHLQGVAMGGLKDDEYNEMSDRTRQNLAQGVFQPTNLQKEAEVIEMDQYGNERNKTVWLQKPHHKIYLPGKSAAGTKIGLDLVAMYEWWDIFSHCPGLKYKFASKRINCSGVVLLALLKGGAGAFVKPPSASMFIDPNQVRRYAEKVEAKLQALNASVTGLEEATARAAAPKYKYDATFDLIAWDRWKAKTALGTFTGRSHVSGVDEALKQYHLLKKVSDADKRVDLLGNLLKEIHSHIYRHPESRRGGAVMELGKQALSMVEMTVNNDGAQQPPWFG